MALAHLGETELDALVAQRQRVVIEVQAPWCMQCASQALALERVIPEFEDNVAFGAVDLGDHPHLGERYGVIGLPAFILFENGAYHSLVSGYKRAPELRALIRRTLIR